MNSRFVGSAGALLIRPIRNYFRTIASINNKLDANVMVIPIPFPTNHSLCVHGGCIVFDCVIVIFGEAKLNYKMLLIAFLFHFNCLD